MPGSQHTVECNQGKNSFPLALVTFAIVLGARAVLVAKYGSPLPFLDSWEALFEHLLIPWSEGTLRWQEFLHPHFEHIILWTKVIALTIAWAGAGTWNNIAQLHVNAALYAGATAIVAAQILPALAGSMRWALAFAFAVIASVPYAWANGLWEIQNCWSLLVGFTALALRGALASPGTSWSRVGLAATLALPFTFAIGTLSVLVAFVVRIGYAVYLVDDPAIRWKTIAAWSLGAATAVGVIVATGSDAPAASTPSTAVVAAIQMAVAWPFERTSPLVVASFLPWAVLGCWLLIKRDGDRASWFAFVFGCWLLLAIGGLAFARSAQFARIVPPRYYELLALNIAVNIGCMLCLATKISGSQIRWQRGTTVLAAIGTIAITAATVGAGFNPSYVRERSTGQLQMIENIRDYLATGDVQLLSRGNFGPMPYASGERFATLLDRPATRRLLAPVIAPAFAPNVGVKQ